MPAEAEGPIHRRSLEDGRVVLVQLSSADVAWACWIEGREDEQRVAGWPLLGVLAEVVGYDVENETIPGWIRDWTDEILESTSELDRTVRHEYGPEGASYVRHEIERSWKKLGGLLARHDIEAGVTWTYVPIGTPPEARAEFDDGLFSLSGTRQNGSFDAALAERVQQSGESAIVCFEDPLAESTDGWLDLDKNKDAPLFFCDGHVYWYLQGGATSAELSEFLGYAPQYPGIGFIGRTELRIERREIVDPATLEGLASNATTLLVEAFDAEGFVACDLAGREG